jgi:hypothetical protein
MTTLNKLTEQLRRNYARFVGEGENIKPTLEDREAKLYVVQATHETLAMEPKKKARLAEIEIPSCMIATYDNQTVSQKLATTTYTISTVTTNSITVDSSISTTEVPSSGFVKIGNSIYSYDSFAGSVFSGVSPDPTGETGTLSVIVRFLLKLPAYPIHLPQDMGVWSVVSSAGLAYIPITTAAWDLLGSLDEALLEDSVGFYVEGRKVMFTDQPSPTVKVKLLIIDPALLGENDPYPVPPEYEATVLQRALELIVGAGVQPEKPKA